MKAAVVYYSRKGATAEVARTIAGLLDGEQIELHEIRPTKQRSYPNWLLRSFLPGSRTEIQPLHLDLQDVDVLFLGTPKWTFSCPPVTEFVETAQLDGVTVALFMTYGGFDAERYMKSMTRRIESNGAHVQANIMLKRRRVVKGDYIEDARNFVDTASA